MEGEYITVKICGKEKTYAKGTQYLELAEEYQKDFRRFIKRHLAVVRLADAGKHTDRGNVFSKQVKKSRDVRWE